MSDNIYSTPASEEKKESPSNLTIISNLLTSPAQAYKDIQASYSILFPISLFFVLMVVSTLLYMNSIDFEWFVEYQVEQAGADLSNAEKDAMRANLTMMSPMIQGVIGSVFAVIGYAILFALYSAYYVINSNISNDGYDFKQWFSFLTWSWIPKCLLLVMTIVIILLSDNGQITQDSLNPISLNALFFNLSPGTGMGSLLSNIDLVTFWSWAIMAIGYQTWTKCSTAKAWIITLLPYVVVYSVWAAIAA
ncbi:YIP1 family protein [Aliikangiella sp. G2MR2-5]|uniref:YIP1 family protein n=1 Tax=Aliikangiella sp. G2MR2-5 TaxID=2788943 RepID=UPI0018AA63A9|nr:YIP1 family protein [Aliikangiella sp. G2MR2-5]